MLYAGILIGLAVAVALCILMIALDGDENEGN